jgi:hypothetical protein
MNSFYRRVPKCAVLFGCSLFFVAGNALAQAVPETAKEKPAAVSQEKPAETPNAAQFELLETKYRFEANGDSRKEVHALVEINSELGARQFARLNFDYNRSFQAVEIPLVHITHANGGTSDILPSAITDLPNPAVEKFPAYQDVRVKSVRILGLQPGDTLEYRVVTTTTKPPLAPDFWLDHSFDRSGVVSHEIFQIDLPSQRARVQQNSAVPAKIEKIGEGESARDMYSWEIDPSALRTENPTKETHDIVLTTYTSWAEFKEKLAKMMPWYFATSVWADVEKITGSREGQTSPRFLYNFVSHRIATVDLPFAQETFVTRTIEQIVQSGYGTPEEKVRLLFALVAQTGKKAWPAMYSDSDDLAADLPRLSVLSGVLSDLRIEDKELFLDPGLEVAPYGMLPAKLRGKTILRFGPCAADGHDCFEKIPNEPPFPASQQVRTISTINPNGALTSKVNYALRGDNELLLRVTFHTTPKEKQLQIAQYLALSDGFRGKVTSVKTSDPYETDKPFEVEYELTQEKFVDWSKKPVRIPALLPLPGLPEAPKKSGVNAKIELGPPLDVELTGTLRLPSGTTAQVPPGTSVKRDYATFASQYSAKLNVLHFSRRLNFIAPELPSDRALDLNAFLHAVQNDQALLFELEKPDLAAPAKAK